MGMQVSRCVCVCDLYLGGCDLPPPPPPPPPLFCPSLLPSQWQACSVPSANGCEEQEERCPVDGQTPSEFQGDLGGEEELSFCAGEVRRRLCDEVTVTTRNFSRDPEDPSGIVYGCVCVWVWVVWWCVGGICVAGKEGEPQGVPP